MPSRPPATSEPAASDYSSLPGVHVTIDQVVAMNIRRWRKLLGITQEELAGRVGWTSTNLSAAELSAQEGKDKRRFDAHTLVTFARALEVSVPALLMPPEDDGIAKRYLFHSGAGDYSDCLQMSDLVTLIISEPWDDDSSQGQAYRSRYFTMLSTYLEVGRGEALASFAGDLTTAEKRKALYDRLSWQREALAALVTDIDQTIDAVADMGSMR